MRKFLILFGFICFGFLAFALAYQMFIWQPERRETVELAKAVPAAYDGWEIADHPLAESEEMQDRVSDILNFTDAIFRSYKQGDTDISVYIAYWEPRKMPVRLVQAHTPDICWVRNGWTVTDSEYSVSLECNGVPLMPAEFRVMTKDPALQYVYYWHVIGNEIYVNRIVGTWDRLDPLKSLFRLGLNQQREQFFIRVASNKPFDEIWDLPIMQDIMTDLADLTLVAPTQGEPDNTNA
ncbi:exosortase C-terminal domain/associated protein EpsI [Rubellicoccus peritrichatus]|uniref:EpsI family protein n=1 Tax=Rubellicoccus peritrichatus TaxID=3080537 RepID=A0AAQ3QWY8_9BACT|nr:exosortase C-terminal domain/associated protein EpsI [Puniceicoccus sp. CR14]WOO42345.1 EpsI family protein [Puniceicoccus sp. CR14]